MEKNEKVNFVKAIIVVPKSINTNKKLKKYLEEKNVKLLVVDYWVFKD